MAVEVTHTEWVSIGGWVFETPACIPDGDAGGLAGVLSVATVEGDDRDVPGVDGQAVRARVRGPIWIPLPVVVFGDRDPDGGWNTSPRLGLIDNLEAMWAAILPTSGSSPLRTIVHHLDDGTERVGECIVGTPDGPRAVGPHIVRVGLTVKIPTGVFEAAS